MIRKLLVAGTAAVLAVGGLTASMAGAAFAADRFTPPSQPVPYSQLNAYMKGSASKRAAILAQAGDTTAQTGTSANTSATTPALPNDTVAAPAPAAADTTGTAQTPNPAAPGAVNPPVATPPSTPSTPAPTPQ